MYLLWCSSLVYLIVTTLYSFGREESTLVGHQNAQDTVADRHCEIGIAIRRWYALFPVEACSRGRLESGTDDAACIKGLYPRWGLQTHANHPHSHLPDVDRYQQS